ncbi:hypothetical protein ACGFZP_13130 [Kitasatospora sp. NPDC048239]|uniref:hypothetical protein n=1 Tax=Kitasatospora sp. NPDC048239 TaxID=3364046 RepID=UPI003716A48B
MLPHEIYPGRGDIAAFRNGQHTAVVTETACPDGNTIEAFCTCTWNNASDPGKRLFNDQANWYAAVAQAKSDASEHVS